MLDCIIIGSGPAGISAGLYMVRAGLKILIISKSENALEKAEKIENYYGFEKPITGKELIQNGIDQAKRLGIEILEKEAVSIKFSEDNCYEITVSNQNIAEKYIAKSIVLATGVSRNKSNIKGIREFEGRGISYCAVCDAAFYKDRDVAILGSGDYARQEMKELLPIVHSVTLLTNGKEFTKKVDSKVQVNTKKIKQIHGNRRVEEIEFEDETSIDVDGIFIAEGVASSVDFAKKIGAKVNGNYIVVNEKMETNVPNLYACGDCTGGILQIAKAVYEGMVAGLEIISKLKKS